jgi:hypothetical protein
MNGPREPVYFADRDLGKLTTDEAIAVFLRLRDEIAAYAHSQSGAFIAKIRRDGVHAWWSTARRRRRHR